MITRWVTPELCLADGDDLAAVTGVSARSVRRHCDPIACDVATRLALYDATSAVEVLARVRPRTPRGVRDRKHERGFRA